MAAPTWVVILTLSAMAAAQVVLLQPSIGYVYPTPEKQEHSQHDGYFYNRPQTQNAYTNGQQGGDGFPQSAECLLVSSTGSSVSGELRLTQAAPGSSLRVQGTIYGLTPGEHGFHVHREPDTGDNCKAAGPHFNPLERKHGGPTAAERHAGDLGNIEADQSGVATVDVAADMLSLETDAQGYAVGRTFVVHAKPDDLGLGGDEESTKTGNAGARVACCVINQRY